MVSLIGKLENGKAGRLVGCQVMVLPIAELKSICTLSLLDNRRASIYIATTFNGCRGVCKSSWWESGPMLSLARSKSAFCFSLPVKLSVLLIVVFLLAFATLPALFAQGNSGTISGTVT